MHVNRPIRLDPLVLLNAYAQGVFPMGEEDGSVAWFTADPRGVIPLDRFHIPGTLRQVVRQGRFEVRFNTCFEQVMRQCMLARPTSWINRHLIDAYVDLHKLGHAHSVEAWQGGELAGGLYGVSLGAAFFGESMYYTVKDASKVALVHLVERLRERKFELLDTQASNAHLRRFGCIEMPAKRYMALLNEAIQKKREFA